ncbi:MAG: protein kinase family protein [Verrucomicrobia bacterium]|nr:protein kinase family protein [Verrucomicrobiota bacterium]
MLYPLILALTLCSTPLLASPESNAHQAARAMKQCFKGCGLKKQELYKMALFIESELPTKVSKDNTYYFSRKKTKLARTIEVDPHTKNIFIHLQEHNLKELGHGARKSVTNSILYSTTSPKRVAHSHTTYPNENEAQAMNDLKNMPGLCKTISVLADSRRSHSRSYSLITEYYPLGDFAHYMRKNKPKFSFQDKLRFCRDIIVGIDSMHSKGYAHRDLGLRNYFVEKRGKKLHLIVADFGRAVRDDHTTERGAQGGYSQLAPEAINVKALKGDDYLRTDIYALGCVFYKILHQKKPSWVHKAKIKNSHVSVSKRKARHTRAIQQFRKRRAKELKAASKHTNKRFTPERVEQIILKMINPNPSRRPTAHQVRELLGAL